MKIVSICIPTYNNPLSLARCLTSVLKQTYQSLEVIITDDSSNDETQVLVESKFKDPRIHYTRNIHPLGSPENWNFAVSKASGELIKIMHHDDWFVNETALQDFINGFGTNTLDEKIVFSNGYNVFNEGKQSPISASTLFLKKLRADPNVIFYSNHLGDPSVTLFPRHLFQQFDRNSKWYVDVIFYNQLLKKGAQLVYLQAPLVNITAGSPMQITNSMSGEEKVKDTINTFQQYTDFRAESKKLRFKILFLELFKRYGIKKEQLLSFRLPAKDEQMFINILKWNILPVPFKLYAAARYLLLNIVP